MRNKDTILLETIYDNLGPKRTPNEYNSFVDDERDKVNVILNEFLKGYISRALTNDAVLTHFKNTKGLDVATNSDHKYQTIQHLLVDLEKNSNIKINGSDIDKMAREIVQDVEGEDRHQYEQDEVERHERFRDSYS